MSGLNVLRDLGRRLIQDEDERRVRSNLTEKAAQADRLARLSREATKTVKSLLGEDVAASLQPWRWYASNAIEAVIGTPDSDEGYLPGDNPGQDGDIRYYSRERELWYRPRMTNASARIRDRNHFAQMLVEHSIYAGKQP